ncbi:unnamed protein product, partial [Ceratitis capitata]
NRPVTGKPLPAILQSNIPSNKEEEILSLEMKKELHVDNTKRLAALETTHTAALITNFSLTIISIIFIAALIIKLIMKINFKAKPKLSSYNMNANKAESDYTRNALFNRSHKSSFLVQTNEDVRFWR